jgi:hypothetical protein
MALHKLDMGKAWTDATALIGANRDTFSAIAGLFFFVPSLALAFFAPELSAPPPDAPPDADPRLVFQAMIDQQFAAYLDNWAMVGASFLAQFLGTLTLLALLAERARPTVGEALRIGLAGLVPYVAALLLSSLAAMVVVALPAAIGGQLGSPVAAALAGLVTLFMAPVSIYLLIRFALITPVIAVEGVRNPITAMQRSWQVTKGNSLRIGLFQLLLIFTIGVIATLVTSILGLVFAAFGGAVATIGSAAVNALVNALVTVVFAAVIAAIHRQLAGSSPEELAKSFD